MPLDHILSALHSFIQVMTIEFRCPFPCCHSSFYFYTLDVALFSIFYSNDFSSVSIVMTIKYSNVRITIATRAELNYSIFVHTHFLLAICLIQ